LGRERGKQRALGDLDLQLRDIDTVQSRNDGRVLCRAGGDRGRERRRCHPLHRGGRRKVARIDADDAPVIGARRRQRRFGAVHGGLGGRQLRFGLSDIGVGHLTDRKTIAGVGQRALQDPHIVLLYFEIGAVAETSM